MKEKVSAYEIVLRELGGVSTVDEMYFHARRKQLVATTEASFYLGVSRVIRKGVLMGSVNGWIALPGCEIPEELPPHSSMAEKAFMNEKISEREAEALWRRMSAVLYSFRMSEVEKEQQVMAVNERMNRLESELVRLRQRVAELEETA